MLSGQFNEKETTKDSREKAKERAKDLYPVQTAQGKVLRIAPIAL